MIELVVKLITPLLPTFLLLLGGQQILNRYAYAQKKREQELELVQSIREQQYKTLAELYEVFGKFMAYYRTINADFTDLQNEETKIALFNEIAETEGKLDALVLKIGCEFVDDKDDRQVLEAMLGDLRQSVQIWRESVGRGEKLPFVGSEKHRTRGGDQKDYMRFKSAFARTAAFMINKMYGRLEAPQTSMERVEALLIGSFDNKYEVWKWEDFRDGRYTG